MVRMFMNMKRLRLFVWAWIIVLAAGSSHGVAAETEYFPTTQARFSMTYESVNLPANEKMGLLGGSLLYDVNDWLALGGSAYGAMAGQRGGFITLGAAAEIHRDIGEYLEINAGGFVGAGGGRGGFALQGGGLMLRTYAGALLKSDAWGALGGGVSWVDFPNGAIHSVQPYLSYAFPFTTLLPKGWVELPADDAGTWLNIGTAEQEFIVLYRRYRIPSGVVTDRGTPQHRSMGLMGVEWDRYLDDHWFIKLESEGAMQGQSHGYMQILAGAGYRQALNRESWIKLSLAVGPAGGGSVATGGGVLLDAQLAFQRKLTDHLFVQSSLGYVNAPGASFHATSFSLGGGYHFETPDTHAAQVSLPDLAGFDARHLRIRLVDQRYVQDAPNWRNHHAKLDVDLLGFQLDYFVNDWFYLTGQGIAAYKGQAGGYMTGLVGAGVHIPLAQTSWFAEADLLGGAAGGGGLDVAGGLVWQADVAIGWRLNEAYSVQGSYGIMQAPQGNFRSKVLSISLGYYFTVPAR